jgi:hypothetical protein
MVVRIRLTRKLAERIDGVDLTANHVGDVLDLPTHEAALLIAEAWATRERRTAEQRSPTGEERRRSQSSAAPEDVFD